MAKKKPAEVPSVGQQIKKVETVAGSDVPTLYVNSANIELSSFDVRLRLGQIQGVADGVVQVKDIVHVFMSHSHFKAFVDAVNNTIPKLDRIPPPVRIGQDQKPH